MSITTELVNFRTDIACDINQLPDTVWTRYYNDWRDKLIDAIIEEKEDFFYNSIDTQTVIGQNEYRMPKRWDLAEDWVTKLDWLQKIKAVSWKINSTDTEYTKLVPKTLENLDYDLESYDNYSQPFFLVQDNSIFIYPTPKEATDLKIYGITYPKELVWTDTDTLPDQYTDAIMLYVQYKFLKSQTRVQESQVAKQEFEEEKIRICRALSGRIIAPITRTTPNLSYLS